jgi:hypothetical protein
MKLLVINQEYERTFLNDIALINRAFRRLARDHCALPLTI